VEIGMGASAGGEAVTPQRRCIHAETYDRLVTKLLDSIKAYFAKHPYRLLMPLADLRSQFLRLTDRQTLDTVVGDLCDRNKVYRKGAKIGLVGHDTGLEPAERELAGRIEKAFRDAGFAPALEEDVRAEIGMDSDTFRKLMISLIERGCLVRLSEKVTYHAEHLRAAQEVVAGHVKGNQNITVGELRDHLGVSRKYALALLEYFDTIGFTRREGDTHVLR
jgi:selenocysteine-specific elongation factor